MATTDQWAVWDDAKARKLAIVVNGETAEAIADELAKLGRRVSYGPVYTPKPPAFDIVGYLNQSLPKRA